MRIAHKNLPLVYYFYTQVPLVHFHNLLKYHQESQAYKVGAFWADMS